MRHPIVLGYDGSACSSAALDEAIELVRDTAGAHMVLVYCHEPPAGLSCALDPGCAAAKELRDYERRVETEVQPTLPGAPGQPASTRRSCSCGTTRRGRSRP